MWLQTITARHCSCHLTLSLFFWFRNGISEKCLGHTLSTELNKLNHQKQQRQRAAHVHKSSNHPINSSCCCRPVWRLLSTWDSQYLTEDIINHKRGQHDWKIESVTEWQSELSCPILLSCIRGIVGSFSIVKAWLIPGIKSQDTKMQQ